GFEDVLFFDTLLEKKIPIFFFNNPVEHNADDDATTFLKKTEYAMENLYHLIKDNKAKKEGFNITKAYQILKKIRLHKIIAFNFKLIKPLLIMNLKSNYPSLLLFDFYKLGYLCSLKK
ncbi:MAG: glycosyltransferase family 2 protein, partial [Confluentibacter sp.]|nr:glycosyltransferase family 2 protein [Confluentibacter sp.]